MPHGRPKNAPHGMPEPKTYHPTLEDFKDFRGFMERIEREDQAHLAGICKIVPPDDWIPRRAGYGIETFDGLMIEKPTKQVFKNITGSSHKSGCYLTKGIHQTKMSVADYHKMTQDERYATPKHEDYDDLEKKYWKSLNIGHPVYGCDVATAITDNDQEVWNIARLDSILNMVAEELDVVLEGVNTAYVYFGMWKATFSWHTEDMDLYSINFVHHGAPKTWYCVPPEHGHLLEKACRDLFPTNATWCNNSMRHKKYVIAPNILDQYGVPYQKMIQGQREIIIVFPYAYHSGWNHGFNIAESTNFALERWVEYGKRASHCDCGRMPVTFKVDEFVKKFQPEKYDDWMAGRDIGPHPEDPLDVRQAIQLRIDNPEDYERKIEEKAEKEREKQAKKLKLPNLEDDDINDTQMATEEKIVDMYKHISLTDVYYTVDPITNEPIMPFSSKMEEFMKNTDGMDLNSLNTIGVFTKIGDCIIMVQKLESNTHVSKKIKLDDGGRDELLDEDDNVAYTSDENSESNDESFDDPDWSESPQKKKKKKKKKNQNSNLPEKIQENSVIPQAGPSSDNKTFKKPNTTRKKSYKTSIQSQNDKAEVHDKSTNYEEATIQEISETTNDNVNNSPSPDPFPERQFPLSDSEYTELISIGEFHGFTDAEIEEQCQTVDTNRPIFEEAMKGGYEYYEFNLSKDFPPDLNNCTGWFDGIIPDYKVKFCNEDQTKMENTLQQQQLEETRKVMPLKIKRAQISGSITTPSPLLQRESREWKPSSQFFKPLSSGWVREVIYDKKEDGSLCPKAKEVVYHAPMQSETKPRTFKSRAELKPFLANLPTLTLHNFSFRQDPLNAPKGQEVVHAIDEAVEIFPPKFESMEKMVASKPIIPKEKPIIPKEVMEPAPVTKTPERQKIISDSTSLSPSLPSGLLKVKMFGKMKEKNAFESSPGGTSHSSEQHNNDDSMEIDDDEDFDLETPNRTQSLGNSGVTITPISHLNKSKRSPSMSTFIPDIEDDTKSVKDPVVAKIAEENKEEEKISSMLDVEVETKSEKYPVIEKNTKVEITNGVSDPKSGRNRTKTVEERKNPIVTAKEKAHVDQGVVKAKTKIRKQHRELGRLKKDSEKLVKSTRRRTKFDFDLWDNNKNEKTNNVKETIDNNDCLEKYKCELCAKEYSRWEKLVQHKRLFHEFTENKIKALRAKHASILNVKVETKSEKYPVIEKNTKVEKRKKHVPDKTSSMPDMEDESKSENDPVVEKNSEVTKNNVIEKTSFIPDIENDTKSSMLVVEVETKSEKYPVIEKNTKVEQKKFKCDICNMEFTFKNNVYRHKQREHEKKIKCKSCSETFSRPKDLKKHIKIVHEEKKKKEFKCHICDFISFSSSNAKRGESSNHYFWKKSFLVPTFHFYPRSVCHCLKLCLEA